MDLCLHICRMKHQILPMDFRPAFMKPAVPCDRVSYLEVSLSLSLSPRPPLAY